MVLNLPLSPETEAKLREKSRASGKPVEDIVAEIIGERFGATATMNPMSVEERLRLFKEWIDSHPRREGVHMDDSRESIYGNDDE